MSSRIKIKYTNFATQREREREKQEFCCRQKIEINILKKFPPFRSAMREREVVRERRRERKRKGAKNISGGNERRKPPLSISCPFSFFASPSGCVSTKWTLLLLNALLRRRPLYYVIVVIVVVVVGRGRMKRCGCREERKNNMFF